MITVCSKNGCGCCTTEMQFRDEESANTAFASAGLESCATITDDAGVVHNEIDTFYGWWLPEAEPHGLAYLAELAGFAVRETVATTMAKPLARSETRRC